MPTNNRTVEAILPSQSDSDIITTINHNFQVITERIKELNISLSYLDLLKISTIFTVTNPATTDANLQNFVSTCWNTLANYAGVYIQCDNTGATVFRWMNQYDVKNGDFIVKLPNNQSLYLEGAKPLYMLPQDYDSSTKTITFRPVTSVTSPTSITLNLSNIPVSTLTANTETKAGGQQIGGAYKDCRFYITTGNNTQEEIFFENYKPGTQFTLPTGAPTCTVYYIN